MTIQDRFKHVFEPELMEEIAAAGEYMEVSAGATILDFGQTVRLMPIVLTGIIKVSRQDESGQELLLYYVNPLEGCAMTFTCCMEQHNSEIRAVAEEDVTMFVVPVGLMDRWLVEYPTWKSFVMKTIRARFSELLGTIDQIAFHKLDERLAHYLKEKSKHTGSTLINLSHEQIAADLATSRVVISRLLKTLEHQKKVLLYRHQIKLLREL